MRIFSASNIQPPLFMPIFLIIPNCVCIFRETHLRCGNRTIKETGWAEASFPSQYKCTTIHKFFPLALIKHFEIYIYSLSICYTSPWYPVCFPCPCTDIMLCVMPVCWRVSLLTRGLGSLLFNFRTERWKKFITCKNCQQQWINLSDVWIDKRFNCLGEIMSSIGKPFSHCHRDKPRSTRTK